MSDTALVIIDVQKGLDHPRLGQRNNPQAESNMALLLNAWRERSKPVVHVKHDSIELNSTLRPEHPGNAIKDEVKPLDHEILFAKSVNSAFIGTGLEKYLRDSNIRALVIVGLTTEHCVSTSVRMAANLGFDVTLVEDAIAAHEHQGPNGMHYSAQQIHDINLASLHGEFCQVKPTLDVLSNLS